MFVFCRNALSLVNLPRRTFGLLCAVLLMGMTACSTTQKVKQTLTPYRAEVVQGNFVSREQVQALRLGMPKQTVRDILGTPLVTSVFHDNRWDYAFTIQRQGAQPQQRRMSVFFQGDALSRIEGDPMPSEAEFAAQIDTKRKDAKVPTLKATEQDLSQYPPKPGVQSSATANTKPLPSSYPPLEEVAH